MKKFTTAALLSLALCLSALAAPKAIPLEVKGDTATIVKSFPFSVTAAPGADIYFWNVPDGVTYTAEDNILQVTKAPEGLLKISVVSLTITVDFEKKTTTKTKDTGTTSVVIGKVPEPTPPTPPVPPVPPIPTGDMRVLIVYEEADLTKYDANTRKILQGVMVRNALKSKTGKDDEALDGKGYRIWDENTDVSGIRGFWHNAIKRPRTGVPFIHIWKGDKIVHEDKLPAREEEVVELLSKFGG